LRRTWPSISEELSVALWHELPSREFIMKRPGGNSRPICPFCTLAVTLLESSGQILAWRKLRVGDIDHLRGLPRDPLGFRPQDHVSECSSTAPRRFVSNRSFHLPTRFQIVFRVRSQFVPVHANTLRDPILRLQGEGFPPSPREN